MNRSRQLALYLAVALVFPGVEGAAQQSRYPRWSAEDGYFVYNKIAWRLYWFGKETTWPKGFRAAGVKDGTTTNYFVIGVLGSYPFGRQMRAMNDSDNWKIHGEKLWVRHFANVNDYRRCHILFIPWQGGDGSREAKLLAAVREQIGNDPVLIATDVDRRDARLARLDEQGAMLIFWNDRTAREGRGQVNFKLIESAVQGANLSINQEYLKKVASYLTVVRAKPNQKKDQLTNP